MGNISKDICPLGAPLQHYWDRLSEIEKKMKFDEEGLFSLAPQRVALEIAEKTPGNIVVDAFCGVGGSSIGFALIGKDVIAVDSNKGRLDMARFNAEIFEVSERIEFIEAESYS